MANLQEIIDYSKANPATPYAQKAAELIKSGGFDQEAHQAGIDLSWAGRPFPDKMTQAAPPAGAESALMPASPAQNPDLGHDQTNFGVQDALKMVPNAAKDAAVVAKESTYGTAKKLAYDIPKAAMDLVKEQGVGDATANTLKSIPEALAKTLWGMVPQSLKEVGNFERSESIPDKLEQLAKDNGGYVNALKLVAKSIPESVLPGLNDYLTQVDKARQAFENHPVFEALGYAGLKGVAEHPTALPEQFKSALDSTKEFVKSPIESTKGALSDAAQKSGLADRADRVKLYIDKQNINPQVSASAGRLSEKMAGEQAQTGRMDGSGETTTKKPSEYYDEYLNQEEKFKTDAHADMALNKVGEDIGKSYDRVIDQRREVGAKMGEELKKVGDLPTDVTDSFTNLENELKDNQNLVYDHETGKLISTTRQNKMTEEDRGLIEKYVADLNGLGDKPTVGDLDAFMSRIPKELDVYKQKNNVTQVTNAERIIKNNLRELRNNLSPAKNPALKDYSEARQAYSDLSDFLDEGSKFLGAKTQSGDYMRDASVAKNSVNSVLGGGKKDWLIELEKLSGDPVLDKTVLALQAMKDAGNPQGRSLLDLMAKESTTGNVPTSPKGLMDRMVQWGLQKGRQGLVGTPPEQTRAFLQSLENNP